VTKRIYGQKRTKKSEPPAPNAVAQGDDDLSNQAGQNPPAVQASAQASLSKKERRRLAREQVHDQVTCEMAMFHRLWRVLGFVLMMGLNIGIVGGDLAGGHGYVKLSWQRETASLILLATFNALVLFPILFEAWFVKADKDGIALKGMFFRTSKPWDKVTDFKHPVYLKLAMLRLGRMLFFLNKRVLPDYPILEAIILRYRPVEKSKV
jgi:hypothetical protein